MKQYLIIILVFVSQLFAETILIDHHDHQVKILSSNDSQTVIDYRFGNFDIDPVLINGFECYKISLDNETVTFEKGDPELPKITRSIIIRNDSKVEAKVINSEFIEYQIKIAPSKGIISRVENPDNIPHIFSKIYDANDFYPGKIVELGKPYILRDVRGITITVYPFSYNPQTEILRVYHHLTIGVNNIGLDNVNVKTREIAGHNCYFTCLYRNHFLNYNDIRSREIDETGRMIVICYDDYLQAINPYVDWKNQKGIQTDLYSIFDIGADSTSMKNFIQSDYDANDGLTFVQLVGDIDQIPSLSHSDIELGTGASDPKFALLEGDDSYPDIFVGRFSAETIEQVETQVERTIYYERDIIEGEWLHKAFGIARHLGPGDDGEYDDEHIANIRQDLLAYTFTEVDELYPSPSIEDITNAINEGRSFGNYAGHGSNTGWTSVYFYNDNVNGLINENKLPFICSVACLNGNFTGNTCFAETWLRSTNNENPTGAIAIYASSINQPWSPPMSAQDEVTDLLVSDQKNTIGGLMYNGSCLMMDEYGLVGISTFKTWHIFGDASLQVRTDTPEIITIDHQNTIDPNQTTFEVSTDVQDALVCLSYENEIIIAAYTDETGNVSLDIEDRIDEQQSVTLTVTAYNKISHIESIPVESTNVEETDSSILENIKLIGNYPNPFNPSTKIVFQLNVEDVENAELIIYNSKGQIVRTLDCFNCVETKGTRSLYSKIWDGKDLNNNEVSSGIYMYKLKNDNSEQMRKMILIK